MSCVTDRCDVERCVLTVDDDDDDYDYYYYYNGNPELPFPM